MPSSSFSIWYARGLLCHEAVAFLCSAIRGGTLATDQLRQVKNTFVVSVTLVSRAAIQGGMDVEDAFAQRRLYSKGRAS